MKKERYIDMMEQVVGAYSKAHIEKYVSQVRAEGLKEHGFPRLTADIGILLAHGRRTDLRETFAEMMDLCCEQIPVALKESRGVGNEFSVKEIVPCLLALEESRVFPEAKTQYWRELLKRIDPCTCYEVIAKKPPERIGNWAAFAAASEQARKYAGLGCEDGFIDNQIASQLLSFDENGMYRDPNEPMVYDITTRLQLSIALYYGYCGEHREKLEELLALGGRKTLEMQSVTGEIPYGGRSNQFLHNEAVLAAVCEFEAQRYRKAGDKETAGRYKAAADLAAACLEKYLGGKELYHIKNRYPNDSFFGCEDYAYFDKYMVTTASFLYAAYLFAEDSMEPMTCPAREEEYIFQTSPYFHKTIIKFGEYFAEYDTDADFHYDANGLGRIHRKGAPSPICLSVPIPQNPLYRIDLENPSSLSICGGVCPKEDGAFDCEDDTFDCEDGTFDCKGSTFDCENGIFGCAPGTEYRLADKSVTRDKAEITWLCTLPNGMCYTEKCTVSAEGVLLQFESDTEETGAKICCLLPAFAGDGKQKTEITTEEKQLCIAYEGWQCRYRTNGELQDLHRLYANRNGHYRAFTAKGGKTLTVAVTICPLL